MRLVASDPTPGAANDGDPSVSMISPTDEAVELGGHVSRNDMDMEIEQGPASSASRTTHPDRTVLLRRPTKD